MSNDVMPLTGGYPARDARRAAKQISSYQAATQVRIAHRDADTHAALAAMENLTIATGWGMGTVVRVARLQEQLEALAPAASGKLAYLADVHGFGIADVVDGLRRDVTRG